MFDALNCGKRSVTLNLKHPDGHALAKRLIVEWADAVAENFAPRAMRGLGLSYDDLVADKPDLVMISACLNGQTGSAPRLSRLRRTGRGAVGLQLPDRLARPRADRPVRHDHRLARAALRRHRARGRAAASPRDRRRRVRRLESGRVRGVVVVRLAARVQARRRDRRASRQRTSDRTPARRVSVCGRRPLGGDRLLDRRRSSRGCARSPATTSRRGPRAQRARRRDRAAGRGHRSGSGAGLRRRRRRPAGRAREHFIELPHPEFGPGKYERNGFRIAGSPSGYDRSGPTLGQDNDWVLGDLLGLSADEQERLVAAGVLS